MRAMKDSGVEWIGQIPDGWSVLPVRVLFNERKNLNKSGAEQNLLSLSYGNIIRKNINTNEGLLPASFNTYNIVERGDIVFRLTDLQNDKRSLRTGLCKEHGIITAAYVTICPMRKVIPAYFHYLFHAYDQCKVYYNMGNGVRQGLNYSALSKLLAIVPPLSEQTAIANYLDTQCGRIDNIISKEQQVIEKLKEYKQSVITEAVTKGLDPDMPMKDSGIEWIGRIPEGWVVSRLKNETENLDYLREPISADQRENKLGLYDYYGASGVIDKIDHFNVDGTVLLIGEDGANLVMRNLPLVYRASGKFWVNNHAHILKVKSKNDYGYFAYLLEAGDYTHQITGSAQPKLSQANLMAYQIVTPPLPEQTAIANYLDKKCAEIDRTIEKKQQLIEKLGEYKKSLIYEMVTGKREVPLC